MSGHWPHFLTTTALSLLVATSLSAATKPQPGPHAAFHYWYAACDNVRSCTITSLPDGVLSDVTAKDADRRADNTLAIEITRDGEANAPVVLHAHPSNWNDERRTKIDSARLVVDGAVLSLDADTRGESWTASPTTEAVRMLAEGRTAALIDRNGKTLLQTTLRGLKAAMLYIDEKQQRAGSTTALVARGSKPAVSIPPVLPLPVIQRVVAGPAAPSSISKAAARATIKRLANCEADYSGDELVAFHRIDPKTTLVAIRCDAGAYNVNSVLYLLRNGDKTLRPAPMDFGDETVPGSRVPILTNYDWDEKEGSLSEFAKGRGLGDCGEASTWVWDGRMFRLVEHSAMSECAGNSDWPLLWRAEVRMR